MSFINNGLTTGLLGYKLRKEFLGEGLYYRETEIYNWVVYALPDILAETKYQDIEDNIKAAFSVYSGDITVKALDTPADYQFPNDHLRVGQFNVQIEIKKPLTSLSLQGFNPELPSDRYKGLDASFFNGYATYLGSFNEDFSFDSRDDGTKNFGHSVSFSLLSGTKETAQTIVNYIFSNDKDTTLGINVFTNGAAFANTTNFQNFYTESYDLIRNTYNFSRKREVLPATGQPYLYDLSHSIVYKNDGFIDVTEKGKIIGRIAFNQTQNGYSSLYNGAYSRCNTQYNLFKDIVGGDSVTDALVNFPISTARTLNKLANAIDYEATFTNNSNINTSNFTIREKTTEIERTEQNFINIEQSFNYTSLLIPISADSDAEYIDIVTAADTESSEEVANIYQNGGFYDARRPTMKRLKFTASVPNRKKQFTLNISYTNNPIYFVLLDGITYAILEYKISDTKPADIITEYKIINRPTKTSLINYAYQTERGSKSVTISAQLQRSSDNMFTSPRTDLATQLYNIYRYAVGKAMDDFTGNQFIALSYYLSDLKYSLNSENEVTMDIVITYAIKKYLT